MVDYRKPKYLEIAVKKKYGQDVFVLGSTQTEIDRFWSKVSFNSTETKLPVEKGRTIVDIDCKSHVNQARPGPSGDKSADWFDEFEITSKKGKDESHEKSYQLQLTKSKDFQFGGNVKLGANIASNFFTMGGGGPSISPEVGFNTGYKTTNTKQETSTEGLSETLSQEYQVLDKLKVPPRTKVKATITTWAVTYEAKTTTKVTVDANASITVRYRSTLSRLLGGLFNQSGKVTAKEIFEGEDDYHIDEDEILTFNRYGKVIYLGEEVEVSKEKTPLPD